MDRSIGARTNNTYERGLSYEYGRKDPFPNANITIYNINGTALNGLNPSANFSAQNWKSPTDANRIANPGTVMIPYSVNNPMVFIANAAWSNIAYASYLGLDSQIPITQLTEKSIFDSCPPGWHLPANGVWDDFIINKTVNNSARGLVWASGLRYYPYYTPDGGATYPVDGSIRWFAQGDRNAIMGNNGTDGVYVYYQTSTASCLRTSSSGPIEIHSSLMGGLANRCVSLPPK